MGRSRVRDHKKRNKRSFAAKIRVATTNNIKFCASIVVSIFENAMEQCCIRSNVVENSVENREPNDDVLDDVLPFAWMSLEEYEEIKKCELEIEKVREKDGYRIVDIQYLMQQSIRLQWNHSKTCSYSDSILIFKNEVRRGLVSTLIYKCNLCEKEVSVRTERSDESVMNKALVWGTLATGSTYEHTAELFSVLDIPVMGRNTFFEIQQSLGSIWKDSLWEGMEAAGIEEYELAVSKGDIDENGIANITVVVDGGWSKRSFGHTYNALSGVAVIIGKATCKVLFVGIKNKFCSICARAETNGTAVKEHLCYKNWTKSSTAMESAIIVEGFNSSILMHKLRYIKFVGDGDSTVYSEIRKKVTYGLQVEKVECMNHCLKNFSKHLYKMKMDTKNVSLECRKLLSKETIEELVTTAQNAIYANAHGDVDSLKKDLRNTVNHVFGNHENCADYMCSKVGDKTMDRTAELKETGAHHHIHGTLNLLVIKSNLLIDKETSNRAELYMSLLARFNMGKRLNLIQRNSFEIRSFITGLKYNEGHMWHRRPWKKQFERSPGKHFKNFMTRKHNAALKRKQREGDRPRVVKKLKFSTEKENPVIDYGTNIAEVFLDDQELNQEIENLIQRLTVTPGEKMDICQKTVGQFDNLRYINERNHRLTASTFGTVVKRRPSTSCNALVKRILQTSSSLNTPAIQYGKINESVAIEKFQQQTGKIVIPSGLFVDETYGFLGASPDGIIDEDEIVEVKCLFKVATAKEKLETFVKLKKVPCLELNRTGTIELKKSHDYYYQVQGQLAVSRRKSCYFIVYSGVQNDLFIQKIDIDEKFWEDVMLPKLIWFYKECLAPEIILNRRASNLSCREPPSIVEKQQKTKAKKLKKKK